MDAPNGLVDMKPDKSEKRIRFGCGFVFGLIVGFFFTLSHIIETWGGVILIALSVAVVCGLLARRYGDDFWYSLKDWF